MRIKSSKSVKPLLVIITICGVVLSGSVYAGLSHHYKLWPWTKATDTTASDSDQNYIDKQKTAFADQQKAAANTDSSELGKTSNSPTDSQSVSSSTSNPKKVTVVVTYAGQDPDGTVDVNAYIPDYYKDGTCTLTFTQGAQTFTRSAPAYRDATTTICTNPLIKSSDFPQTGNWSLVVSYSADGGSGSSSQQTVTVK